MTSSGLCSLGLRRVALAVFVLVLPLGDGRACAGDPPSPAAVDPEVEEFLQKAETELRRLDRVTLRWMHAQAPEATRAVEGLSSYTVDRAVPKARRAYVGTQLGSKREMPADPASAEWWKKAQLPMDLSNAEWWKNAQSALEGIRSQRTQFDRSAWGPSYELFDGRHHTRYHEQPTASRWGALRMSGPFFMAAAPDALKPAYYLSTGETIAQNIRRMGESRVVRTGFGRTAVVSIGRVEKDYGQWLILRGDGAPIVEEWADARGMSLDALADRLRKATTIEETRTWREVLWNQRVLGWIESKDLPPVPETTVMRSTGVMGPNAGRGVLVVLRTTYVGPLDAGAKFEGIPNELSGATIDVLDYVARIVERRHPDGRIEPLDGSYVDWEKHK